MLDAPHHGTTWAWIIVADVTAPLPAVGGLYLAVRAAA